MTETNGRDEEQVARWLEQTRARAMQDGQEFLDGFEFPSNVRDREATKQDLLARLQMILASPRVADDVDPRDVERRWEENIERFYSLTTKKDLPLEPASQAAMKSEPAKQDQSIESSWMNDPKERPSAKRAAALLRDYLAEKLRVHTMTFTERTAEAQTLQEELRAIRQQYEPVTSENRRAYEAALEDFEAKVARKMM